MSRILERKQSLLEKLRRLGQWEMEQTKAENNIATIRLSLAENELHQAWTEVQQTSQAMRAAAQPHGALSVNSLQWHHLHYQHQQRAYQQCEQHKNQVAAQCDKIREKFAHQWRQEKRREKVHQKLKKQLDKNFNDTQQKLADELWLQGKGGANDETH